MDERVRFVARLLEGEQMTAALCAEFGISGRLLASRARLRDGSARNSGGRSPRIS